jgi:hypothetical protein
MVNGKKVVTFQEVSLMFLPAICNQQYAVNDSECLRAETGGCLAPVSAETPRMFRASRVDLFVAGSLRHPATPCAHQGRVCHQPRSGQNCYPSYGLCRSTKFDLESGRNRVRLSNHQCCIDSLGQPRVRGQDEHNLESATIIVNRIQNASRSVDLFPIESVALVWGVI